MDTTTTAPDQSIFDKGKLFIKAVIIFVMALGLWIPTYFIMGLVKEREGRQKEAIADISNKWAGKQTVTGPILMIPYNEHWRNDKGQPMITKRFSYFMPDNLDIQSNIEPQSRKRGIYEVIVYSGDVSLNGKFKPLQWQQLKVAPEDMVWNEAVLLFSITDHMRGVNEDITVRWDDSTTIFNPQPAELSQIKNAFIAPINIDPITSAAEHSFSMKFSMSGSEQILFTAAARENKMHLKSTTDDLGFTGVKLPEWKKVDSGIVADWKYMNRSVPAVWNNTFYDLGESTMGANLVISVDSYDKTERSVKYALLCIILTFAAFFLIETIYGRSLHLIQYGLAGLALVLFYTLLLSISEYTGFNLAYLIAGVATIGLVAWYVGGVMRSTKLALFISFVLTVVYSYIFTIIQLQDYSLLMGSIGLFLALGIIMYFSRKIYN